jgi:hypothetical protein
MAVTKSSATVLTIGVYHHSCDNEPAAPVRRYEAFVAIVTPKVAMISTA